MKSAIIGLGNIARSHAISIREHNLGDVVAVCDVKKDKMRKFKETYALDGAKEYEDYLAMLDSEEIDVVHICTPHYLHKEMVIQCLKRNINALCEKPLCLRTEELKEIELALQNSTARVGVVQQNRYNESAKYLKTYLQDKEIVTGYATLVWNRGAAYYGASDWHGKLETEGGGVIINQALHTLDLLQWFMGMPTSVCGNIAIFDEKDGVEVEDTAVGRFYGEKSSFEIFASNTAEVDCDVHLIFKLKGGEETIMFPAAVLTKEGYKTFEEKKPLGKDCYGSGHEKLIADFYACVKDGKPFALDFEEASKVVKLFTALYRSHGKKINIEG
jgi:predicted dehydrogenase